MSMAGWSAGKLSAPKFIHSVSASGPTARANPSPWKISQISSTTRVTGCVAPTHRRRPGMVRSSAGPEAAPAPASAAARASNAASNATRSSLAAAPTARRSSGASVASDRRRAVSAPLFRPRTAIFSASSWAASSAPTA